MYSRAVLNVLKGLRACCLFPVEHGSLDGDDRLDGRAVSEAQDERRQVLAGDDAQHVLLRGPAQLA